VKFIPRVTIFLPLFARFYPVWRYGSVFNQKVEIVETTVYSAVMAFFRFSHFDDSEAQESKICVEALFSL
jgi:hypothetical protein